LQSNPISSTNQSHHIQLGKTSPPTKSDIPNLHPNHTITQGTNDDPTTQSTFYQQILPQYITKQPKPNDSWVANMSTPPINASRIFFQNINGLKLQQQPSRWKTHLQYMAETGISICGLAETNTN
jgi:hypothetical protein